MANVNSLNVNGKKLRVDVDSQTPLLYVLRDHLNMTGTKYGCGEARCGACTVLVDGQPMRSCVTPVGRVGDKQVTAIEGVEKDGKLTRLPTSPWADKARYTPGQVYCPAGVDRNDVNPRPLSSDGVSVCRTDNTWPRSRNSSRAR